MGVKQRVGLGQDGTARQSTHNMLLLSARPYSQTSLALNIAFSNWPLCCDHSRDRGHQVWGDVRYARLGFHATFNLVFRLRSFVRTKLRRLDRKMAQYHSNHYQLLIGFVVWLLESDLPHLNKIDYVQVEIRQLTSFHNKIGWLKVNFLI